MQVNYGTMELFIFWPLKLNFENFKCLNNTHPSIYFWKIRNHLCNEKKGQVLNF